MINADRNNPAVNEIFREFERRRAEDETRRMRERIESDKKKLHAVMSEEAMLSLTYVPYAVAEVAWDYVDTIHDYLKFHKRDDTKKLSRAIQEIRRKYDRDRFSLVGADIRPSELHNSEKFQTELGDVFARMHGVFDRYVREVRPDMEADWRAVAVAAFSCQTIIDALYRFASGHQQNVSKILQRKVGSLLPIELWQLQQLVGGFADGLELTPPLLEEQRKFAEEFGHLMIDIECLDRE